VSTTPARPFVSVKFAPAGRKHSFLLPDLLVEQGVRPGDEVVVESADGQSLGSVARVPSELAARRHPADDSTAVVVRRASQQDIVQKLKHQQREQEAHRIAQLKIRERGLQMKLTRVEYPFDGSRLIFYYTADARVDFRELVRDLAGHFHVRIEMRQIGVRDEAKMLGGYGSCGRPLCCTTWLNTFEPVSIKMAKQQQLSLNPSKLSGQCGRLKCCLRYELPNGNGVKHGGCADGGHCTNPTGCGSGSCGSCGSAGSCGSGHE
jgi:cell fate regulator YaaT (PSP1 superfamily)